MKLAHRTPSDEYSHQILSAKGRKPPKYVGYAVDADRDGHSTTANELLTNNSGTSDGMRGKTNDFQLPTADEIYGYGWKEDEGQVWRAACRELNCVEGSACVPDTLHGRRPRCQCPLGTDGQRCERRTSLSTYEIHLQLDWHGVTFKNPQHKRPIYLSVWFSVN